MKMFDGKLVSEETEAVMDFTIDEMKIGDYDEVMALWQATEGVGLDEKVDSREGIGVYLARNPGTCFVARHVDRIIAAVLCGHDGRRGYLHHMAVAVEWRKHGIARSMVNVCLGKLASLGIPKCNIFLKAENRFGEVFWKQTSWLERGDLKLLQRQCI
jgi:N-acetylglutamate synthase